MAHRIKEHSEVKPKRQYAVLHGVWSHRFISVGVVAVIGSRHFENYNFTLGYLVAALMSPLWIPLLVRSRRGALLFILVGAALVSSTWLTFRRGSDHEISALTFTGNFSLLVGLLVAVGAVVWCSKFLPVWGVAAAYGAGMISSLSMNGLASENLWKFGLSQPATIIILALAWRAASKGGRLQRRYEIWALLGLVIVAALNDARSLFATMLLVLALSVWQTAPPAVRPIASVIRTCVALVAAGAAIYILGEKIAVGGYLGPSVQSRSMAQIEMTGSLLLGGRPEVAATSHLFMYQPAGFGAGTIPSPTDILVAKSGMFSIGYDPNNGYVEKYMLGIQFELHSVIGDLWASFGIGGLLLAVFILVLVLMWVVSGIVRRKISGLKLFLATYTVWNLFFSPLYSALPTLIICLGLLVADADWRRLREKAHGSFRSSTSHSALFDNFLRPAGPRGLSPGER